MPPLSRDAILTVLSGLAVLACDKAPVPAAEPVGTGGRAATAASVAPPAPSAAGSAAVEAREVPSAQGKPAGKEMTCAPGGCAPGQCGANKK
jgi:hypothetical protein